MHPSAYDPEGGATPCEIGGLSVFVEFLQKFGYRKQVSEHLPIRLEASQSRFLHGASVVEGFDVGVRALSDPRGLDRGKIKTQ